MTNRTSAAVSQRVFSLLLAVFPRAFRDRFEQDMRDVFSDQLAAARARSGVAGTMGVWLRTVPAMVLAALSEARSMKRQARYTTQPSDGDRMLETLIADLRFALRTFRKSPTFAFVSVLCISIGSGAVTTIYSAMNAMVLRPLPGAADGGALVRMERKAPGATDGVSASYPLYERLRATSHTLSGVAAWGKTSLTLRIGDAQGEAVYGNIVSGNFFDVLRVRPELGRFFVADEDRTELTHPVIVISDRFWRTQLSANRNAIGQTISVNGHPYTLVGVAPAVFEGLDAPIETDAWIPLMMQAQIRQNAGPLGSPTVTWLRLCGRLTNGVSAESAHRELAALTRQFAIDVAEPAAYGKYTDMQLSKLTGLPPDASGPLTIFLAMLLGAAAMVLLIASVNVASMLSARALARRREMAVRAALGASRSRLVRQLLTEILVLFGVGAAGGTLLAMLATAGLEHLSIPGSLPISLELSPDWRVLAFALAVSLVTGVVFGLAPALQAAGKDIATRMRDGSVASGSRRTFLGNALVVGQLALSLSLLVAAGLFMQALDRGNHIDPGFDATDVATASLNTESWGYDAAKGRAFYRQLREQVSGLAGVTAVSYARFLPLTMQNNGTNVQVDGGNGAVSTAGVPVSLLKVDADYFSVIEMPLVAGRGFTTSDDDKAAKVVVVNETFARRYWPKQSAVGHTIGYHNDRVTIVGVARDAKYSTLTEHTPSFVYFPLAQDWEPTQTLMVRTSGDPLSLAPAIQRAVRAIDPALPIPSVTTLRQENSFVLVPQRVAAIVSAALGLVGLLLATVGLYGVISYSSSRRSREIGIRLALGARRSDVLQMILREGMRLTATGVAIGVALAMIATRLLVRYLFGVSPLDAVTFLLMPLLFVVIAAVASYLPARRASGSNPMVILRGD
jgi:predicted permease